MSTTTDAHHGDADRRDHGPIVGELSAYCKVPDQIHIESPLFPTSPAPAPAASTKSREPPEQELDAHEHFSGIGARTEVSREQLHGPTLLESDCEQDKLLNVVGMYPDAFHGTDAGDEEEHRTRTPYSQERQEEMSASASPSFGPRPPLPRTSTRTKTNKPLVPQNRVDGHPQRQEQRSSVGPATSSTDSCSGLNPRSSCDFCSHDLARPAAHDQTTKRLSLFEEEMRSTVEGCCAAVDDLRQHVAATDSMVVSRQHLVGEQDVWMQDCERAFAELEARVRRSDAAVAQMRARQQLLEDALEEQQALSAKLISAARSGRLASSSGTLLCGGEDSEDLENKDGLVLQSCSKSKSDTSFTKVDEKEKLVDVCKISLLELFENIGPNGTSSTCPNSSRTSGIALLAPSESAAASKTHGDQPVHGGEAAFTILDKLAEGVWGRLKQRIEDALEGRLGAALAGRDEDLRQERKEEISRTWDRLESFTAARVRDLCGEQLFQATRTWHDDVRKTRDYAAESAEAVALGLQDLRNTVEQYSVAGAGLESGELMDHLFPPGVGAAGDAAASCATPLSSNKMMHTTTTKVAMLQQQLLLVQEELQQFRREAQQNEGRTQQWIAESTRAMTDLCAKSKALSKKLGKVDKERLEDALKLDGMLAAVEEKVTTEVGKKMLDAGNVGALAEKVEQVLAGGKTQSVAREEATRVATEMGQRFSAERETALEKKLKGMLTESERAVQASIRRMQKEHEALQRQCGEILSEQMELAEKRKIARKKGGMRMTSDDAIAWDEDPFSGVGGLSEKAAGDVLRSLRMLSYVLVGELDSESSLTTPTKEPGGMTNTPPAPGSLAVVHNELEAFAPRLQRRWQQLADRTKAKTFFDLIQKKADYTVLRLLQISQQHLESQLDRLRADLRFALQQLHVEDQRRKSNGRNGQMYSAQDLHDQSRRGPISAAGLHQQHDALAFFPDPRSMVTTSATPCPFPPQGSAPSGLLSNPEYERQQLLPQPVHHSGVVHNSSWKTRPGPGVVGGYNNNGGIFAREELLMPWAEHSSDLHLQINAAEEERDREQDLHLQRQRHLLPEKPTAPQPPREARTRPKSAAAKIRTQDRGGAIVWK